LLPPRQRLSNSPEAVWLTPDSPVDSLTVTYMIVAIEKKLETIYGIKDSGLTTVDVSSLEESPLYSMANMIKHVSALRQKYGCVR